MNIKGLLGTLIAAQIGKAITGRGGRSLPASLGGSAGTAIAGALAGMILGRGKGRSMGGAMGGLGKLGGLAAIGTIAWQAYQEYQAQQARQGAPRPAPAGRRPASFLDTAGSPFGGGAAATPPQGSPLAPATEAEEEALSRVLVRAMIAAAKSDGHVDAAEEEAIAGELGKVELSEEDRAFVIGELRGPLDVDAVARGATSPELASAIYAASLLAVTVDTDAERTYLARLAERLALDPALVASLHAKIEETAPAA